MKVGLCGLLLSVLFCSPVWGEEKGNEPRVLLHLLSDAPVEEGQRRFWIDWCDKWQGIEESKVLEGEDAKRVLAKLKSSLKSRKAQNLCGHSPAYGVVARDEEGRLLKTSLCFSCVTWVRPGRRLTIEGQDGIENELCLLLREYLELPESVLEAAERRKQGREEAEADKSD